MISVTIAQDRINSFLNQAYSILPTEVISLESALGRVNARSIMAALDVPGFDNSAVDGFALRSLSAEKLKIIGEVKAGSIMDNVPAEEGAIRIMTGAPIPLGFNTVVMQEDVIEHEDTITLTGKFQLGTHIRRQGEDIAMGALALESGVLINPAMMGFLASIGQAQLEVIRQPKVSVIVTGDELVKSRSDLRPGKILESNSVFLRAALQELGLPSPTVHVVGDDRSHLKEILQKNLEDHQLILLTGGVSVGKYDFTKDVLSELGLMSLFWKVNQKPGKPLYAGTLGQCLYFGLPGNPFAVCACFYHYVRPALKQMMGQVEYGMDLLELPLNEAWVKKDDKSNFLRGKIDDDGSQRCVNLLGAQGSHQLSSLVDSDCLILVAGEARTIRAGELVRVLRLTGGW